jgi:hypothetical protein
MQIWDNIQFESAAGAMELGFNENWNAISWQPERSTLSEFLKVEVELCHKGLQVLRIANESPLRRLRSLGSFTMHGLVESGDRIIAIDGVLASKVTDLDSIMSDRSSCEITIFDQRTRLTVSWQIQFEKALQAA